MLNDIDLNLLEWLRPERVLDVDEWADEHRILSNKASAEPGKYRTSRTPYLRQIMKDLSIKSPIETITVMKGAQIGFTEVFNNWIGYIIDHTPAPTMIVWPNIDMAKRNSKTRIEPLIEESPRLKEKVSTKKSRDSDNTIMGKAFPGGSLIISGANSAASLRSAPVRFLGLDEIDAYKQDLDGEGSPIKLAKARTRTFNRRKILQGGTPTTFAQSITEDEFEKTNKNYYNVPCLACGHYQKIIWQQIKWQDDNYSTAKFECVACAHKMSNYEKTKLLDLGKWIPENPEAFDGKAVGYHISSLYSPHGWYSWEDAVKEFLESKKSPELLKSWVNTVLGETWKEKTDAPDWQRLYERREPYALNVIPKGVCFLTCGVDVQADRIELEVVGWARNKVTYSIDYRVLRGDTAGTEVWNELSKVLGESWPREDNPKVSMGIKLMAVDSGYQTQTVYDWVRKYPPTRVIAIKGMDGLNLIHGHPKSADVTIRGKTIRRGLKVWPVGTNVIKAEFYGWLRQAKAIDGENDPFGYCHFPEYGPEFFKMLTAEALIVKFVKGYKKSEWVKTYERNESLDTRCYARAAASICGIDRFTEDNWRALESDFRTTSTPLNALKPKVPKKKRKRESNWL